MTKHIDLTITTGDAIRFAMLQSHYRSPMDLGAVTATGYKKVDDARKTLRRLALASEPSLDAPPLEIIQAVSDDLNTPKAIAQQQIESITGGAITLNPPREVTEWEARLKRAGRG